MTMLFKIIFASFALNVGAPTFPVYAKEKPFSWQRRLKVLMKN